MKLHLPKQLFTALLAAITLATPATLTLGSTAWGLSVSYEKSFSTTGGTGTVTFTSWGGDMTYDYSTGILTLPEGTSVSKSTIDFDMLYTWETEADIQFIKTNNTEGTYVGLYAQVGGTVIGSAGGTAYPTGGNSIDSKAVLEEAYAVSGKTEGNTIRTTAIFDSTNGVDLYSTDTGAYIYDDSSLKYSSGRWDAYTLNSSVVKTVYYAVTKDTEGARTLITSSDGKWKKSYATGTVVAVNNADSTADVTVLNEGVLEVGHESTKLANLGKDIFIGGSGQLRLQTWVSDTYESGRDIDISGKTLYLDNSSQDSGALRLGCYSGNITLGNISLIGDTKITKEAMHNGNMVTFAGNVIGNYTLTLAPERDQDRFDGVKFTGNVDVTKFDVKDKAEITFSGTTEIDNFETNDDSEFTFLGTTMIGALVSNGDAEFIIGQDAEHTATMTLGRLELGNDSSADRADSLTIHEGSLLKITGSENTGSGNVFKNLSFVVGEWRAKSTLSISGRLLAKEAVAKAGNAGGDIIINSTGTLAVKGLATAKYSTYSDSVLNLTLEDGGKLILGSEGIKADTVNPDIRFGAGVVGMYADATTIGTAITLQSTSGTTFDTAKYTFADDGDSISQLAGATDGTMTISGVVSGTGKLIKAGAGTLKLSAENTYSGGTEIAGGTLELTDAGTLGTAAAVINSGAKLQFSGTTDKTISQNLTGGGEIAKQGSGRVTLAGTVGSADVAISKLTLSGGTLELQNTSYIGSIATSGGANLTFSGKNVVHTVLGDLTTEGSMGALTINAGTTLNVNGSLNNTWGMSGGIVANGTLDANVLSLKYDTSEQSVSGTGFVVANQFITGNHGTYRVSVSELTVGAGGFSVGHDGRKAQVYLSSENATINGAVTIAADSKLEVSGGSTSINKNVSGVGALAISGGSLTLNGERNSIGSFAYTGGDLYYTTLIAGSATINGESTLSNSGHLTVTGTLAGRIENTADGKVTLASGMSITADTNASITGAGITEFGGTLTNNGTLTLGGVISLSGDINQHYVVREAAAETGLYVLDYTDTTATNTAGNGFKLTSGGSYWLVQGGTTNLLDGISSREGYTITQVTDANKAEGERVGDVYISSDCNVGREFYISSGSVDVGTSVQDAATGYTLQGGSMIITAGSVSASAITCDSDAYTDDTKKGIITVGAGAELLLDTMPGGASLLNLLKGEGMVNAESAGRLVVTTAQSLGGSPETTYKGKLEIVGARLSIGAGQHNTNKLSSLSEIILNDGGNIFYNGKDDGNTSVMDFQKITVESGTGEFHLEDSGASEGAADTIQFGEIAVAAGATMQLTSRWQDSAYYVDKLTGAGEFHAKSATDSGLNKELTVNNLAGFSGDLVFTNAGAGFEQVTVKTGSSEVNFRSLSVNDVQGFTFNVQADTTIGLLSATSGTVDVSENKTLTLGGGTAEAQKLHSIGTLSAASAGVTLGDYATLTLGAGSAEAQKQHSIGTLSGANASVTLGDYATLTLGGGTDEAQKQHSIGTLTGGTGSMLNLAQHAVLNKVNTINGTVTLTGSGTYDMGAITTQWLQGNAASILGVTLADDWTGVVKVSGNTSSGDNDVNGARLDDLANENSWVELDSVEGWIYGNTSGGYDHAVNLILSGTGLTINASSLRWYGFSKSIKGTGNFTLATASGDNQSYNFTGDISEWAGAFVVNANGSATPDTTLNLTGGGNLFSGAEGSGVVMNRGGVLNVNIGKADADTTMRGSIGFGEVKTGTLNLTVQGNTEFQKSVEASQMTVNSGKTATFNNTATAGAVSNAGQIKLGEAATVTGGSMSKVQMSSTGITGTAQDGSSSISDADIEIAQLAQDASFTIADMTLSNVKLNAVEGASVALNNVSGTAELAGAGSYNIGTGAAQYTLGMTPAQVGTIENDNGSTALTLSYSSNTSITMSGTESRLWLSADPTADVNGVFGTYNLTLTLNYTLAGGLASADTVNWQELVGFTGILGDLLTAQTPEATVDLAEGEAAVAAAGTTPTVEYNYTAPQGDAQVGTLVITINGLNVPEPTTATLSLLALAALAARRRRK